MTRPAQYASLPQIMVAPNGARRKTSDHAATPVTIDDTVQTAISCAAAGAGGIHAHLRDAAENHLLDAGMYRDLQAEIASALPGFYVQITTEAVGIYNPQEQRQVVYEAKPHAASVSVREMLRDGETADVKRFYHAMAEEGVAIQHILYSDDDMRLLARLVDTGIVPRNQLTVLFVLGRYSKDLQSSPDDLAPFMDVMPVLANSSGVIPDWACCAFGAQETACLQEAVRLGGKARIGFENNVLQPDGTVAPDNAARIKVLADALAG